MVCLHSWESFLKIDGWDSEHASVSLFLKHYSRKLKSMKTRENVCLALKGLCLFANVNPDELVTLSPEKASGLVQGYVDSLADKGFSVRYVNVYLAYLQVFFRVNGFKGSKALETERHYMPARYRKRSEYIPASAEIYDMALAAGSLRNKALVLALYTSGLRNSTLRALLYQDVKEELERGLEVVKLPVYAEMKKIDDGACKGNIGYFSFVSKETSCALRQYCSERKEKYQGIGDGEPLFASDSKNVEREVGRKTPVMKKSLEDIVKRSARIAGVKRWKEVNPHCLRKAFEFALRNAGLDPKDQEFMMGHILPGSQDAYYDKTKVGYLRSRYAQVVFFPERICSNDAFRRRQILDVAKLLGYSEDKIKKVEDALARHDEIDDAIDEIKKLSLESTRRVGWEPENRRVQTRIVKGEGNLVQLLNENWNLVKELSDDRFILKRQSDQD